MLAHQWVVGCLRSILLACPGGTLFSHYELLVLERYNSMELFDCWGVIYQKDDWTKTHDHWPHPWSFVYYIRCGEEDAPLQFPDADLSIHPSSGEMVLFPGWVRHAVPIQDHDSERIIVAGNISPVLFPLAHPFRRFEESK